jgi:HK97 family phage prohead protease
MKKENTNIEKRYISSISIRKVNESENKESRTVEGYSIVFNSVSEDMGFREIIEPTAIDEDTIKRSDIFFLLNHDDRRGVLARSKNGKGTLTLSIDDKGLKYEFEAPKTALGDELIEMLNRGDIDSSSFSFSIAENGDTWTETGDGQVIRTVSKIDKLYDCSAVYQPAYSDAICSKRFLDFKQQQNEKHLAEYITNLEKQIKQ